MEGIILGLLLLKPMTGYEIAQYIKQNLPIICSSSAGSIQNAVKNLIKTGAISYTLLNENNKPKKIFAITPIGMKEFEHWIGQPMQLTKVKNMELSKLFFLGFASADVRISNIKNYIAQLLNVQTLLTSIQSELTKKSMPSFDNSVISYQYYTLDYGIKSLSFELEWYSNLLKQLEDEQ